MRDVLGPLRHDATTCILPFQPRRLAGAVRVVVESCPAVTLPRLGLPNRLYKQSPAGPLEPRRRRTRRGIVDALARWLDVPPALDRRIMRDPGADALDAVLSALGAWQTRGELGARLARGQGRARREGWHYA